MRRTVAPIALVLVLALALALALAGCAGSRPDAGAQKAECIQNMMLIHTEMALFQADTGEYPPLSDVLSKTGKKCPSGGTYSFDPSTGVVSCSVHGPYKP